MRDKEDVLDFTSEEMKKRAEKMVLEYAVDDAEGEAEARFVTSPIIQALIAMGDPLAHLSQATREESRSKKWTFAKAYYLYAADFKGNNVTTWTKDMEDIVNLNPRWFEHKAEDVQQVSNSFVRCKRMQSHEVMLA